MSRRALPAALILALAATAVLAVPAGGQTFVSMSATVDPEQPTVDDEFAVDVHLESAEDGDELFEVRNVSVYAGPGDGAEYLGSVEPDVRLSPGSERAVRVDELELDERGVHTLYVEAELRSGDREREHVVTTRVPTRVYSPEPLVQVDAASAIPGAWRSVNLTVANRLDEPLRGVSVRVEGEDVRFAEGERVAAAVGGNEDRTIRFRATTEEAGVHPLTVAVSYEDPDGQFRELTRTVTADFTGPDSPGEVRLTGVSVRPSGNGVEVSGSASNVGSGPVESVVVAVADAPDVEPVQPQPEYFVGTVAGSDFASFSVNARLSNNRTTIPLEVTYRVDGVEQTTTREVAYEGRGEGAEDGSGGGGGGFPTALVVVAALFLAIVGVAWRVLR